MNPAGLQAAARILSKNPSLKVIVLERNPTSGGRVRDVQFKVEGVETGSLGAWKIDSQSKLVLKTFEENAVQVFPWDVEVQRMEIDGSKWNSYCL
jgi:monoamine oxidase